MSDRMDVEATMNLTDDMSDPTVRPVISGPVYRANAVFTDKYGNKAWLTPYKLRMMVPSILRTKTVLYRHDTDVGHAGDIIDAWVTDDDVLWCTAELFPEITWKKGRQIRAALRNGTIKAWSPSWNDFGDYAEWIEASICEDPYFRDDAMILHVRATKEQDAKRPIAHFTGKAVPFAVLNRNPHDKIKKAGQPLTLLPMASPAAVVVDPSATLGTAATLIVPDPGAQNPGGGGGGGNELTMTSVPPDWLEEFAMLKAEKERQVQEKLREETARLLDPNLQRLTREMYASRLVGAPAVEEVRKLGAGSSVGLGRDDILTEVAKVTPEQLKALDDSVGQWTQTVGKDAAGLAACPKMQALRFASEEITALRAQVAQQRQTAAQYAEQGKVIDQHKKAQSVLDGMISKHLQTPAPARPAAAAASVSAPASLVQATPMVAVRAMDPFLSAQQAPVIIDDARLKGQAGKRTADQEGAPPGQRRPQGLEDAIRSNPFLGVIDRVMRDTTITYSASEPITADQGRHNWVVNPGQDRAGNRFVMPSKVR